MPIKVEFNVESLEKGFKKLSEIAIDARNQGTAKVAEEIMRLSQFEVPHDVGDLQNSGTVVKDKKDYLVGYNRKYAARLHENPQYNFQKGRKGKYLEDPIKRNLSLFLKILGGEYRDELRGL